MEVERGDQRFYNGLAAEHIEFKKIDMEFQNNRTCDPFQDLAFPGIENIDRRNEDLNFDANLRTSGNSLIQFDYLQFFPISGMCNTLSKTSLP
jgi:hypothetical protein